MKFLVMSEREIVDYSIAEKHIVISITSPGYKHPELPIVNSRVESLQLKFHDIDKTFISKGKEYPAFSKEQARDIWSFFNYWACNIKIVICQCEVGISRSAGVAAGLAKAIGQDDSRYFKEYIPNMLIYRLILEVGNERCT